MFSEGARERVRGQNPSSSRAPYWTPKEKRGKGGRKRPCKGRERRGGGKGEHKESVHGVQRSGKEGSPNRMTGTCKMKRKKVPSFQRRKRPRLTQKERSEGEKTDKGGSQASIHHRKIPDQEQGREKSVTLS